MKTSRKKLRNLAALVGLGYMGINYISPLKIYAQVNSIDCIDIEYCCEEDSDCRAYPSHCGCDYLCINKSVIPGDCDRDCPYGEDFGPPQDCICVNNFCRIRPSFLRGDSNADNNVNIADPIFTFSFLFMSGYAPSCLKAADANDDGRVNIIDPIYTLGFEFYGGPTPSAPFHKCDLDPTLDQLSCVEFVPCCNGCH